jgi:CheY-like chemotaxis protein
VSQVLDALISLAATHPTVSAILAEAGLEEEGGEAASTLSFLDTLSESPLPRTKRSPTVLVVEDDDNSLELLRIRLEFLGCHVVSDRTVEGALALALKERPDLFIVDLELGADAQGGLALIHKIRGIEATAKVPIVIHSVYIQHQSELPRPLPRVEALLPKPFKLKQLVELVSTLCQVENELTDVVII